MLEGLHNSAFKPKVGDPQSETFINFGYFMQVK